MRATTEKVNGVWQGACYPFREGLSTGILNVIFTPEGNLLTGGTNRGWPVRGNKPFDLERIDWSGKMPFEIQRITIEPDGFKIAFTKPVDSLTGKRPGLVQDRHVHPHLSGCVWRSGSRPDDADRQIGDGRRGWNERRGSCSTG